MVTCRGRVWSQVHRAEGGQLGWRLAGDRRVGDVDLGDGRTRPVADVGHPHCDGVAVARPADGDAGQGEPGVGEAVAEGEQGFRAGGVVVAVTDVEPFGVVGDQVHAGPLRWSVDAGGRGGGREGHRQPPTRVDVAVEQGGDGGTVLLARVPVLDHPRHLSQPGHEHRAPRVQHDHGARVGGGHRGDELVLVARQEERRPVERLGVVVAGEDDGHVSLAGRGHGVGHVDGHVLPAEGDARGHGGGLSPMVEGVERVPGHLDADRLAGVQRDGLRPPAEYVAQRVCHGRDAVDVERGGAGSLEREGVVAGLGRRERPRPDGVDVGPPGGRTTSLRVGLAG